MEWSEKQEEISKALVQFSKDSKNPAKTKVGQRNNYAGLEDVISATRPLLAKCGINIMQDLGVEIRPVTNPDTGSTELINLGNCLTTYLRHSSGEYIKSSPLAAPYEGNNAQTEQKFGGTVTYLRRFQLAALLNVVGQDEPEDSYEEMEEKKRIRNEKASPRAKFQKLLTYIGQELTRAGRGDAWKKAVTDVYGKMVYVRFMSDAQQLQLYPIVFKALSDISEGELPSDVGTTLGLLVADDNLPEEIRAVVAPAPKAANRRSR